MNAFRPIVLAAAMLLPSLALAKDSSTSHALKNMLEMVDSTAAVSPQFGFQRAYGESLGPVLARCDRVDAFRLHWFHSGNVLSDSTVLAKGVIDGYPIKEVCGPLSSALRIELIDVIADSLSHLHIAKWGMVMPDVGFRFSGATDTVTVILTLSEQQWIFSTNGSRSASYYDRVADRLKPILARACAPTRE